MKYFCIILILLFFTCAKDNSDLELYKKSRLDCARSIDLGCNEDPFFNDYYFKALINNKSFCVKTRKYSNSNGVAVRFTPLSPFDPFDPSSVKIQSSFYDLSLSPPVIDIYNGLYQELTPIIHIQSPFVNDSVKSNPQFYLDAFFNEGEYEVGGSTSDRSSTYVLTITWVCVLNPGYAYYKKIDPFRIPAIGVGLSTLPGNQKKSKLKIQKSELVDENGILYLDLEILIECDLYFNSQDESYKYYGRLTNGVYKTRVKYQ